MLVEELHEILFLVIEDSLFMGIDTSKGVERLYSGVIGIFNKAILAIESHVPHL